MTIDQGHDHDKKGDTNCNFGTVFSLFPIGESSFMKIYKSR